MASPHPAPTRLRTRAGDRAIRCAEPVTVILQLIPAPYRHSGGVSFSCKDHQRALTQLARGGIACTTCGVHIPLRASQWDRLDLDAPLKG